jgi:hypothetical protein
MGSVPDQRRRNHDDAEAIGVPGGSKLMVDFMLGAKLSESVAARLQG